MSRSLLIWIVAVLLIGLLSGKQFWSKPIVIGNQSIVFTLVLLKNHVLLDCCCMKCILNCDLPFAIFNKSKWNQLVTLIVYAKDAGFKKVLVSVEQDAIQIIVTPTKENASQLFEVFSCVPLEELNYFSSFHTGRSQDPCSSRPCNRGSCLQILNAPTGYNCLCSGTNYYGDRCETRKLFIISYQLVFTNSTLFVF